jgi:small subunit ribosomal protein S14
MKKKKFIQKDFVLRRGIQKYEDQRIALKTIQSSSLLDIQNRFFASIQLAKLKFRAFPNKARNRCVLTGRSRGVYNFFKISRIMIKDLASKGLLPGVKKAS